MIRAIISVGRGVNALITGMGSAQVRPALRCTGLLLGIIWAVFLPVLVLVWYALLSKSEVPFTILLVALADSLIFVAACFVGIRWRLVLPVPGVRVLIVALVALLLLPAAAVVLTRTLPLRAASSLEILRFYYGWVFDAYSFTVLGLLAGLNGYSE